MRVFETDQLKTFVTVADSGSLSAAAPRLFLSPRRSGEQLRVEERAGRAAAHARQEGRGAGAGRARLLEYARAGDAGAARRTLDGANFGLP